MPKATCGVCSQPVDPASCSISIGIPSGQPTYTHHGCRPIAAEPSDRSVIVRGTQGEGLVAYQRIDRFGGWYAAGKDYAVDWDDIKDGAVVVYRAGVG